MEFKKSFFDWTVFKKTICRFWPLWAAYFAIWLVSLPLSGLMMLRLEANARPGLTGGYMENFAFRQVPGAAENACLPLAVMFGVLCAMAVFSHLYNARSANLFGSLPIKREGLFVSHYLAGLAFFIVPNAVIFLLTLLVELAGGCVSVQGLLFWLGVACGECFFFYSLAVFCAMFTGHILALPAFYGIVNILAYGVTALVYAVFQNFYYGFSGFGGGVSRVVKWLTPTNCLSVNVRSYWDYAANPTDVGDPFDYSQRILRTYGLGTVGIYALAAAVLTGCAFLLYRARRLESAGDVVSVRPMKPVFKYGVAFCVGMVFGVGTSFMLGGGEFTLMAAILIWGVIGYFAAQMLLDKSFRVFKKWKGGLAVTGVFIALFLVVGFDLTGYETRIPDPASVKSVQVDASNGIYLNDTGDSIWLDVTDPAQIGQLVDLHRAAVAQRDHHAASGSGRSMRVELTYTLNSGSTLTREYWVTLYPSEVEQEGTAAWAMERLYHNTDFYWRAYEFDRLEDAIAEGKRLDRAEFWHYDEEKGQLTTVVGYGNDARALLDAVEEDFQAGRIGVRTITNETILNYEYKDTLVFCVTDPAKGNSFRRIEIALDEGAAGTLTELERLGADLDLTHDDQELREALQGWMG
ncbi:MAG: ABC transporter permease [Oscillospiraceae bacterium]|nr:ABC transporter permease [Oscillospiraceae bacterium]MDE7170571.1 ABC transporter permease [Oscillospiraceae bacterium]